MRGLRRWPGRAVALLLPGLAACMSATWRGAPAEFPPQGYRTPLALRDPLERPPPSVQVTLGGSPSSREEWWPIHTGDTWPAVSPDIVQDLGLKPDGKVRAKDIRGKTRRLPKVRLPSLAVGDLLLREVRAAIDPTHSCLGQSIVGHTPWEIDWARGRFTLGPALWPDAAPDVTDVLLRNVEDEDVDVASVQVEGRAVDLVLDTGLEVSALPLEFAASLRTEEARVWPGDSLEGGSTQRLAYGDVWLGTIHLGSRPFAILPASSGSTGHLGLDILRRFDVEVVPGRRLRLRPRAPLWDTARERVARWAWMPACEHVGCITAHFEPADDEGVLTLAVEGHVPAPMRVLLACPDTDPDFVDPGDTLPEGPRRTPGPRHLEVALAEMAPGPLETHVPQARAWFGRPDACRDLAVLDVIPAAPAEATAEPVARLVP
jgi:hypothetical protein